MAFMGIFLINIIFIILGISVLLFLISLILFIIFLILSKKDNTKKGRKIAKVIFGVLTIIFFLPLLFVGLLIGSASKEKVTYNGKKYKLEKEVVKNFQNDIKYCDTKKLDKDLKKHPELINSTDLGGILPLGIAIRSKEIDCIEYFLDKNVDINKVSNNDKYGTLEYIFYNNYYDEEVFDYLIEKDNLDINKHHKSSPISQEYIRQIIKDKNITDKELEILNKLLDKGLDMNEKDEISENTYDYINSLDNITNLDKLKELVNEKNDLV